MRLPVSHRRVLARGNLWITPRNPVDNVGGGVDNCPLLWKCHRAVTTEERGHHGPCGEPSTLFPSPAPRLSTVVHTRPRALTRSSMAVFHRPFPSTTATSIFNRKMLGYTWGNVSARKRFAHECTIGADLSPLRNGLPSG